MIHKSYAGGFIPGRKVKMKMERQTCAFNHGRGCGATTRDNCEGCTFFKTREQVAESREKSERRLKSLPDEQRMHIGIKYKIPEILPAAEVTKNDESGHDSE